MTALLEADPLAVRRGAAVLDVTADAAARLSRQLDRQRPPCWQSPSRRDYVTQLHRLSRRVERIVRSHDEAAEVLAVYARALEEAQERSRYAQSLQQEGQRRSAQWAAQQATGPDPGWSLTQAATHTQHEAAALERQAAARAAARLRELAAAAPEQSATSKALRPLEDVGLTVVEGLRGAPAGAAALAGAAWSAVPGFHDGSEQREGRRTLAAAARFWEGWVEAWRDATNGRPGLGAGAVAGGLPKRVSAVAPDPSRRKRGGFLDGIAEGVLTVDDFDEAWEQAQAAKPLNDRIVSLQDVPLPGVQALLAGEVDLAHHEARGGHTILKHVGKRLKALQARLDLETNGKPGAARSTFPDLATAEELVRQVLLADPRRIRSLADSPTKKSRTLTLDLQEPVGTVLRQDGTVTGGRSVVVVLRKERGEVYVETAWLEP